MAFCVASATSCPKVVEGVQGRSLGLHRNSSVCCGGSFDVAEQRKKSLKQPSSAPSGRETARWRGLISLLCVVAGVRGAYLDDRERLEEELLDNFADAAADDNVGEGPEEDSVEHMAGEDVGERCTARYGQQDIHL